MADILFTGYSFLATGANAVRNMPDRLADVINVLDYGALGNGGHDDRPNIQGAFDAAFGSVSSPHGATNATKNRPVFFPNGNYLIGSPGLKLKSIVGGYIYGAGSGSTQLIAANNSGITTLAIDGATNLVMESISIAGSNGISGLGSIALDLDWTGGGGSGVGLTGNVFRDCAFVAADYGVRIAHSNSGGGDNNLFYRCALGGTGALYGIDAQASTAINNVCEVCHVGDSANQIAGFYSSAGQIHVNQSDCENTSSTTGFDIQVDSGLPVLIRGGRSESKQVLKVTSGIVKIDSFSHSYNTSGGVFINITGGTAVINCCVNAVAAANSLINGSGGTLYLTACNLGSMSGFTGTVARNI